MADAEAARAPAEAEKEGPAKGEAGALVPLCVCACTERLRVRRRTRLAACACLACTLAGVAAAVIAVVVLINSVKPVKDVQVCYLNICSHGTGVDGARLIDFGNIEAFSDQAMDAAVECASNFQASVTGDGSGTVYASVALHNPNAAGVEIRDFGLVVDVTPVVPPGMSEGLSVALAAPLKERVLDCREKSLTIRKGGNNLKLKCTIFLRDTVVGRALQAHLEGFTLTTAQRATGKVHLYGVDVKFDEKSNAVIRPTTPHPNFPSPPPPVAGKTSAGSAPASFLGNSSTCPGTTDLHFELPTVWVCGVWFTDGVQDLLVRAAAAAAYAATCAASPIPLPGCDNPFRLLESVELDATIGLYNPTAFPVKVIRASATMTHNDGGGGSSDGTELAAELANPVNIRSNMTELLVLRTQLTAQYAASVAQELIDGKFELNVAMEMEISVLETTFAVKIPPLTVYASTPSDDFRGSYEGTR